MKKEENHTVMILHIIYNIYVIFIICYQYINILITQYSSLFYIKYNILHYMYHVLYTICIIYYYILYNSMCVYIYIYTIYTGHCI